MTIDITRMCMESAQTIYLLIVYLPLITFDFQPTRAQSTTLANQRKYVSIRQPITLRKSCDVIHMGYIQ